MLKESNSTEFETKGIKSRLWDYFHPFISVTGDVTVTTDNNTDVAFINCEALSTYKPAINDLFNQNNCTNFDTECIKSSLWDYFHAFILVPGDITITACNDTDVAFTNCTPISTCKIEVNDLFKQRDSTEDKRY